MGGVAAAGGEAHKTERLGVALGGTAAEGRHSTSVGFVAIARLVHHTSDVGHVLKEMQLRLESSIAECGK
jgi:hypothetical protein